jgi:drug/metabolite transporter (DMT)-like permease
VPVKVRAGFIEVLACTLAWGTIGPIVKQLDVPASVIVFFRLLLGFAVVGVTLAFQGRMHQARPQRRGWLLVVSGAILAVHWLALFAAFKRLTVAMTILIVFLGPVLMATAAPFVLRERLRPLSIGALLVAFAGTALIALPDAGDLDGTGVSLALFSAVLFAVLILQGKLLTQVYEPAVITFWQLGVAALVLSPTIAGADPDQILRAAPGLLLLGAVFSGALGIVFFHAVRALQAQQLGVLFYLEPASAILYAWWWLAERPAATTLLGGGLIVAAGLVIILTDRAIGAAVSPEVPS